jgi:hypothetical protein
LDAAQALRSLSACPLPSANCANLGHADRTNCCDDTAASTCRTAKDVFHVVKRWLDSSHWLQPNRTCLETEDPDLGDVEVFDGESIDLTQST